MIVTVDDKRQSTKRYGLSNVIKTVHGSCLLGDCIYTYNVDSLMGVLPLLVYPVCAYDENCTRYTAHTQNNNMKLEAEGLETMALPGASIHFLDL